VGKIFGVRIEVFRHPTLKAYILENSSKDDVFLIQGDFGGCYEMVNFVKSNGMTALHSTTKRDVIEQTVNGKVEKFSRFEHRVSKNGVFYRFLDSSF
jgi:hypothetical protein